MKSLNSCLPPTAFRMKHKKKLINECPARQFIEKSLPDRIQELITKSKQNKTWLKCKTAMRSYEKSIKNVNWNLPLRESDILLWISTFQKGSSAPKGYISALRQIQKLKNIETQKWDTNVVKMALKGLEEERKHQTSIKEKVYLNLQDLEKLILKINQKVDETETLEFRDCLVFIFQFGLRAKSEFFEKSNRKIWTENSKVFIKINRRKCDRNITLTRDCNCNKSKISKIMCAVHATIRSKNFEENTITYSKFNKLLKKWYGNKKIASHSLRRSHANIIAEGLTQEITGKVKSFGNWRSSSYLSYLNDKTKETLTKIKKIK
jgi:hypothetical protein